MDYKLSLLIEDKAKNKKDGCYRFRGVAYRVRGGKVTHYATKGEILENYGNFVVKVGDCSHYDEPACKQLRVL